MIESNGYSKDDTILIRKMELSDANGCFLLIKELAEFEKAPKEVQLSVEQFTKDFNEGKFDAFVAVNNTSVLGMALYYPIYSTWKGNSMHLEDLVVKETERRKGLGKQLFEAIVTEAKRQNAGRLQWQVLDWNLPAINFYKNYPALFDGEWFNVKISNNDLQEF